MVSVWCGGELPGRGAGRRGGGSRWPSATPLAVQSKGVQEGVPGLGCRC